MSFSATQSINKYYTDSWALIIGIDKYKNIRGLDYAVKDAEAVKDMLINKFDYPKENIKYLVVTRGLSGAILYEKKTNKFYFTEAFSKNALDKIGAGDAMLSIMSICLYNKVDIIRAPKINTPPIVGVPLFISRWQSGPSALIG